MIAIIALYMTKWHRYNHTNDETCYYFEGCMEIDSRFECTQSCNEL